MVTSRTLKETFSYIFQWEHWRREETQWTTMVKTPDIIEPEIKLHSDLVQGSSPYSTESPCFKRSYVTREKTTELIALVAQPGFLESQGSNRQQAVGDLDGHLCQHGPLGMILLSICFPSICPNIFVTVTFVIYLTLRVWLPRRQRKNAREVMGRAWPAY